MKLPNFLEHSELNRLRRRMGILPGVFGKIEVPVEGGRLTDTELETLSSRDGLDVRSLRLVRVLKDGTLAYKNSRIFFFIRDFAPGAEAGKMTYHIADCDTFRLSKRNAEARRCGIGTRLDGTVWLDRDRARKSKELVALRVCEHCLEVLHFDGFDPALASVKRSQIIDRFTLERFFTTYSRSLPASFGVRESAEPIASDLFQDNSEKSNALRASANWTCQNPACGIKLSQKQYRKFLHIHEFGDVKSSTRTRERLVLCVSCHSNEPGHANLKSTSDYMAFLALKPDITSGRR